MKISIDITDEKQLEQINALLGEIHAEEFLRRVVQAGLRVAAAELQQIRNGRQLQFTAAKPEFKTLDVAAITEALKDSDAKNPVKLEVGRLVSDYTAKLSEHAKKNGNKLPKSLRVNAQAPIEKVAFQITAEAIKHVAKHEKKKAAQ